MTIPINYFTGGASGINLVGCKFELVTSTPKKTYKLLDQKPTPSVLASGIVSGTPFGVSKFRGFDWTLTLDDAMETGSWASTIHVGPTPSPEHITAEEEGTFQAAAGGHEPPPGEEDEAASSAASA